MTLYIALNMFIPHNIQFFFATDFKDFHRLYDKRNYIVSVLKNLFNPFNLWLDHFELLEIK